MHAQRHSGDDMSARYARSTREAFPCERFPAVEVYRTPLLYRWWRALSQLLFVVLLFGGAGVLAFTYLSR